MTNHSFTPAPERQAELRAALGCFATGVAIVTATGPEGPIAMTVNSFTSVSLAPPLVLWCPALSSARHDAFVGAQRFAIHLLAENDSARALHFARSGSAFDLHPWHRTQQDVPVFDDALVRLDCKHHAAHPGEIIPFSWPK